MLAPPRAAVAFALLAPVLSGCAWGSVQLAACGAGEPAPEHPYARVEVVGSHVEVDWTISHYMCPEALRTWVERTDRGARFVLYVGAYRCRRSDCRSHLHGRTGDLSPGEHEIEIEVVGTLTHDAVEQEDGDLRDRETGRLIRHRQTVQIPE